MVKNPQFTLNAYQISHQLRGRGDWWFEIYFDFDHLKVPDPSEMETSHEELRQKNWISHSMTLKSPTLPELKLLMENFDIAEILSYTRRSPSRYYYHFNLNEGNKNGALFHPVFFSNSVFNC